MNTNFVKILIVVLCLSLCLIFAAGCNTDGQPETVGEESGTGGDTTIPDSSEGVEKSEWDSRFTDEIFQNYTVVFEGRMSVTQDGAYDSTSDVWQKIKVTSNKFEITMRAGEVGSPADSGEITIVEEGDAAEIQKIQNSQLFLLILRDYDSFEYDAENNMYTIPETIVLNEVLKGVHGDGTLFDVPTEIEIRKAVVTFTEGGMLSSFNCDYSQTMNMEGQVVTTSGKTTWTFTDFGTTVIE